MTRGRMAKERKKGSAIVPLQSCRHHSAERILFGVGRSASISLNNEQTADASISFNNEMDAIPSSFSLGEKRQAESANRQTRMVRS